MMGHGGTHHSALTAKNGFFTGIRDAKRMVISPGGGLAGLGQIGNVYFVARALEGGSDSNDGLSPQSPLLNLQTAIDKCPGMRPTGAPAMEKGQMGGDFIIVGRGTHNVSEAIRFNKFGLTVMAADAGMPPAIAAEGFTFAAASGYDDGPVGVISQPTRLIGLGFAGRELAGESLLVERANPGEASWNGGFFSLEFCRFACWFGAMAAGLRIKATDQSLISSCVFDGLYGGFGGASIHLDSNVVGGTTYRVSHLRIMGNKFSGVGTAKHAIALGDGSAPQGLTIAHNYMDAGFSNNTGKLLDNNDKASTGLVVKNYTPATDLAGLIDNRTNMLLAVRGNVLTADS